MVPPLILRQAKRLGLNLIAVTDHNACHNAEAVIQAAEGTDIHVLPGMELQSKEEVFRRLPPLGNKEEIFGAQFVVDSVGEWVRTEERFLAGATDLGLEEIVAGVHSLEGMVIPAHVDRPSFSLLSNLGWVPESLKVQALEVTPRFVPRIGFQKWPQLKAWCLIVNGDAHRLQEMRNRTLFKMDAPVIREIDLALKGEQGRRVVVEWPEAH